LLAREMLLRSGKAVELPRKPANFPLTRALFASNVCSSARIRRSAGRLHVSSQVLLPTEKCSSWAFQSRTKSFLLGLFL
jgi:hypothetical protein